MKKKLRIVALLLVLISWGQLGRAQSPQDCFGAIPVCQSNYSQSVSYTGNGAINELNPTNQGCLTTGENNSVWYIVNITTAGNFTFSIIPNTASDDYDFALYDITDKSCTDLMNGLPPLRCNYASIANTSAGGLTGLNTSSASPSLGAMGPSFSSAINATVGRTFLICINNASSSSSGYTLSFGGSSSVVDNIPPTIKADTIEAGCGNPSFIKLQLSENIRCNTLATNGSDFMLSPPNATIASASSTACGSGSKFTNLIQVNFSNPLPPGNYTLSIVNGSDANTLIDNCNNPIPVNTIRAFVVQPPVQVNITTQAGCSSVANGVITASGQFGTGPYQYRLNAGSFGSNNIFSGLPFGTYVIRVRDINGCIDDTTVTLAAANPIIINNIQLTNPLCFGQNTGSVTITASGGNPPLQYTVNTQAYQSSNTITGLGPGNYIARVKDANGCIKDSVIFISTPGQISFNGINLTPATCGLSNGSISANGFGGTPPLQFSLNSGPLQASGNFTSIASGTYSLRIMGSNGCFVDTTLQIVQQGGVSLTSLNILQPTCTANSGSITVNASGGVGPNTFSLNGGAQQGSNIFPNLSSGTYTMKVTDANGCTSTAIANLISPSNQYFSNAFVVKPTCTALGTITVQGAGGTAPLTYALNTGPYSSNSSFTALVPGTYTIHLRDANNCIHDTIITLSAVQIPSFSSVPVVQPSCSFPNSGSIVVNVSNGTPAYSYTINGGTPTSSNTFSNLSSGNYNIIVTDANGCTLTTSITLQQVSSLSFSTFTKTNVGCFGSPLGTINATVTNGNPAYQYTLNGGTPQANGNFTNLNAGNYSVVASDASGCSISSVVIINTSVTVMINSLSSTASPCYVPSTGTITVNGTVSNPPILYTRIPGGSNTTGNFTGLPGGTYTIRVSDAANCSVTSTIVVVSPPPMHFTNVVVTQPLCFGGVGSISLLGAGGTLAYLYRINTGPFGSTSSWNNLIPASYTIRLLDANGCTRDTSISIVQPPGINISSVAIVNAACNMLPTGSATVTATGGTPPLQFNINGGVFGSSNSFTNLGAGVYSITVRDANNCSLSTTVNVLANGNFAVNSVTRTQPSCFGGNNGSISFGVTGGIAPFQYSLNLGAYQSSNSFTGLSAGSFNLRAIDNSGCFDDTVITLTQPTAVNFSTITPTNPSCNGGSNGSVTLTGSGGVPPYNYRVNSGSFGTANTLGNLPSGTHTISVRDGNNCIFNSTITLNNPTSVVINNLTIINPGCLGGGGTISYAGSGGNGPYTYSINGVNYVTPGLFSNLPSGTYTIYVKDGNGCIDDSTFNISGSTAVTITSFSFSRYVCPGMTNGTINVTATSANMPMLYNIIGNPPQPTGVFTGLGPGTYTVRSEDNQGCYMDSTITILQAPPTVINSVQTVNASCSYSSNGSLTINASGGVQPLQYQLGGSGYTPNPQYNNLGAGNYIVYARDSAGCTVSSPVVIIAPPKIVANSIIIQQPFCSNATNGQISINVSGGVPPYLYAVNTSLYTTSNSFINLFQGVYVIHIRDANNCQFDTTINLIANNYMQYINVIKQNVSCAGGNNGSISLSTTGGFTPYSYTINTISNGNSGVFNNLGAGPYTIRVTDNLGCQFDSTFNITEPPNSLHLTFNYMTPNLCKGDSAGVLSIGAIGGTAPYQFSKDGVNYQSSGLFTNLLAGFYQIYAKDINGCIKDSIFRVTEPDTSVQMLLVNTKQNSCVGVNDGSITVKAQYGLEPYVFTLNGLVKGADTFYNNLAPGNYTVEVTDNIGCKSTGKYIVPTSTINPVINIDSLVVPFCRGDKDGLLLWNTNSPYAPFIYTLNGNNLGSINFANNLGVGTYNIEMIDDRGCKADTSILFVEANPIDLSIVTSPAKCEGVGNDGGARAEVVGGLSPYTYLWSSNIGIYTDSVFPVSYGKYFAIVTDDLKCTDTAQYTIKYEPCCKVTLPNAFTPNGDGLNDKFRIIGFGQIALQRFEIFNRWGNKVFSTNILSDSWDGFYKNSACEIGTYYYVVTFKCHFTGREEQTQGDVTLIR